VRRSRTRSLFDETQDRYREVAATAPRNTREPGSPEWCYQTMSLLKVSYRSINVDHESFSHYLNELREHRAWEKVPVGHPYGSEEKMLLGELGKRVEEIKDELAAVSQELRAQESQITDRKDRAANEERPVGTNQYSEGVYDNKKDVHTRPAGNRAEAALRRLRHAAKDDDRIAAVYQRVLDGELTANAGMVEAGFRKKRASRKMSALDRIKKLVAKLTADEREELRRMLE
jgi:hypothetical protein